MKRIQTYLPGEQMTGSPGLTAYSEQVNFEFTSEETIAALDQADAQREWARRVKASSIPKRYLSADIVNCSPEIQGYAHALADGCTRGLILRGNVGAGKTYAGCAILRYMAYGSSVRFATIGDVIVEIKKTFGSDDNESDILAKYRNVRLLMIDDLGKEKPTAFVLEKIFSLIDGRYRADKPTIITTQYSARQLAERLASEGDYDTAEAIVSRLQESEKVLLENGDRRCQPR